MSKAIDDLLLEDMKMEEILEYVIYEDGELIDAVLQDDEPGCTEGDPFAGMLFSSGEFDDITDPEMENFIPKDLDDENEDN